MIEPHLDGTRIEAPVQKEQPMYSTIVVGTDGSDTANSAVSTAADLARLCNAELHVVTAYRAASGSVAVPLTGAHAGDSGLGTALSKLAGDEMLADTAASIKGVTVKTHASSGGAADVLVKEAASVGADLIVVGSKGMQGTRRLLGSVPNTVAHNAPCAVLIVKTT
jgi:nucleotide-binding universal stress UspA family protein